MYLKKIEKLIYNIFYKKKYLKKKTWRVWKQHNR